jgi:Na+/H+ antiporter NhaC
MAKEKLAYLADSSSAPSCILFPLNAWGAYIMGLLLAYPQLDPFKTLVWSIPFNFYPILTLIMVFYLAQSGRSYGAMATFEKQDQKRENEEQGNGGNAWLMIVPLLIMVITMPLFLVFTGWDSSITAPLSEKIWVSIGNGSGSASVLYAITMALTTTGVIYGVKRIVTIKSFFEESLKGMSDMIVMAILMVLAFAIGNLCNALGTGQYVADVTAQWLSPALAPLILFITSCFVAFSTGTSWGTFAIMISIAVPLAETMGINIYLAIAAVLGGGVFGDHCSPISDTTLISSVAARCDHIDHVRTQLPYALTTGAIASVFYLIAGFILS